MYSKAGVLQVVTDAVRLVQGAGGHATPALSSRTDLLHDVEGFDSLNALEVVAQVGEDLGVEIPDKILHSALKADGLTIGALVDLILGHVEETAHVKEAAGLQRHR